MSVQTIKHFLLLLILFSGIAKISVETTININLTKTIIIHLVLCLVILLYYNYLFNKFLFRREKERTTKKQRLHNQRVIMKGFLNKNYKELDTERLRSDINFFERRELDEKIFKEYHKELKEQLAKAKKILEEKEHEERIEKLSAEEKEIGIKLKNAEEELERKTETENEKKRRIKEELDLDNKVFYKEKLNTEEIEILKNEDYEQTNEYCIINKKVMTVYVKRILNHKKSHTFLQYNIVEFLEINYPEITKIEEHDTKDADITFKYNNRYYALEIETGTLIKKARQLAEKISYLNTKYKDRWMFVVTNKNLLTKYKKHGLTTQRTSFEKDLRKLLKINTQ